MDLQDLDSATEAEAMDTRIRADVLPAAAFLGLMAVLREKEILSERDFVRYEAASLEALDHLTRFASAIAKLALVSTVSSAAEMIERLQTNGFELETLKDDLENARESMHWVAERYGRAFDVQSTEATLNLLIMVVQGGIEEMRELEASEQAEPEQD